jgi:transposase
MNVVSTLGIDLAKNTFSMHGVDAQGAVVVRRTISRNKLAELVMQLPPCLIGMEACSGAHEWARRFSGFGHSVKLMAPKFVAPYRKSGKNDGKDALPARVGRCVRDLLEHAERLTAKVLEYEHEIRLGMRDNELARRAQTRQGIGPITASALVATVGNGRDFKKG